VVAVKQPKHFATEADLCARFLSALPRGWTPYNETAGWDILLVRNSDGFQIGIQAKLKLNAEVIAQTLEDGYWPCDAGPDCRAVLVPDGVAGHFGKIAACLGLTVLQVRPPYRPGVYGPAFTPDLPDERHDWAQRDWFEQCPVKRHELPEYVPDVAAGASAPLQLTKWKIAAIKIAVTLEQRGYVTRADFKQHRIDHRRWVAQGWLKAKAGRYLAGQAAPNFKAQHPVVWEQIAADAVKWMPKPAPELMTQPAGGVL
jgi:hypothetical protein